MSYLAIDIGASSGRHMLGKIENGKVELKEVYRFKNGPQMKNGHLCWNREQLFKDIVAGMKKCAELGETPQSVAIDCFGVDFVLLDENDEIIGDTVSYRDNRTADVIDEVHSIISEEGIILKNFEWKKCNVETYLCYDEYISKIAKLFSYKYGFNEEIVLDLLITKNNGYAEKYAGEVHYITLVPKE